MFRLLLLLLVSTSVSCSKYLQRCEADACEERVPLRIDTGWLCGRVRLAERRTRYHSFRGVPYGKPPLFRRRFKELEPRGPWEGYYDAAEESPVCPQKDRLYGGTAIHKHGMSEDCIYLNLHIPERPKASGKGLPILVMIHGGGFECGSGLTDLNGPEYLMSRGVILITFNYRLNVFGFLSLRSKEIPGNQGLRDQVTLLRWVQRNARAFGGDPDNVTLMGQSAGGASAHILSLSKATSGLFNRIILMSGTAVSNFFTASPVYAKKLTDEFLSYAGINSTDPKTVHRCLIQMPLHRIMQAFTYIQHKHFTSFSPVIEDRYDNVMRILDDEPLKLVANGRGKNYPTIIGFTSDEAETLRGRYVFQDMVKRAEKNQTGLLFPRLLFSLPADKVKRLADKVYQWYFDGNITLDTLLSYETIKSFKYPAFKLAQWRAITGTPAYLYEFGYESQYSVIKEGLWTEYSGAAHIEDLTYIFRANSILGNRQPISLNARDSRMKDWMVSMFTNFMRCDTPTCEEDESSWPPVTSRSLNELQYQSIAQPGYRVVEMNNELLQVVRFLETLDRDSENVTQKLVTSATYENYRKYGNWRL